MSWRVRLGRRAAWNFLDFVFQHSYKAQRMTVEVGLLTGLEITVKMADLRKRLSFYLGRRPKTREEVRQFWLDSLPDRNIARVITVKGLKVKLYFTKKQLMTQMEGVKKVAKSLAKRIKK